MQKGYDVKCYELAKYFLAGDDLDIEENREQLAQHIQDEVETFIEGMCS